MSDDKIALLAGRVAIDHIVDLDTGEVIVFPTKTITRKEARFIVEVCGKGTFEDAMFHSLDVGEE